MKKVENKMKGNRYSYLFTLVFAVIMGTMIFITLQTTDGIVSKITAERVETAKQSLVNYLEELADRAEQRARLLAARPRFIEALRNNEYETIKEFLVEFSEDVGFIRATDANGIILARSYIDMRGDDISQEENVAALLRGETPQNIMTILWNGNLAVGAFIPVYDEGSLVAIVNCIFDLTNSEYLDAFKQRTGSEAGIFMGAERIATTITDEEGSRIIGTRADDSIIEAIFDRREESAVGFMELHGRSYSQHYSPLVYNNETIGMLLTGVDIQSIIESRRRMNNLVFIISALGIAASGFLIFFSSRYNSTLTELSKKTAMLNDREKFLGSIDTMIALINLKTDNILYVNERLKKEYGFTDSIIGEPCWKVFNSNLTGRCGFCPKDKPEFIAGKPFTYEYLSTVTGKYYRIINRLVDWPDGSRVCLAQYDDITEAKKAIAEIKKSHEELRHAKEAAEEANKSKSGFLAKVSHEIRTPMNVILGITDSQLMNEKLSKKVKEAFEKIYDSGHLLLSIINDILDMSKIESGKSELIPANYDIISLINDTATVCQIHYGHKHLNFKLKVNEDIPVHLFGDELRVKQILNNLLSNSFKYTNSGEVELSFAAEKTGNDNTIILVMTVRDTGQGMTPEQVQKMFDEYSRFNLEANRATVGTGLGMAITHNLVKMMGGHISVESEPGKGTVVTVRVPQVVTVAEPLGIEAAASLQNFNFNGAQHKRRAKITREPMPYGKVLVVDDMPSNLDVAKLLLKPYQLQIDTAESGQETINLIKSGKEYDMVFLDHMMPVMDGMETAKILRGMGYRRPIIALTANAVAGQQEMFLANGFDGFISKPIDIRQLNDSLNKFVRNKKK